MKKIYKDKINNIKYTFTKKIYNWKVIEVLEKVERTNTKRKRNFINRILFGK